MSHEALKEKLIELAEGHLDAAQRNEYEKVREDASKELECWQTEDEDGIILTACSMISGEGLTVDDFRAFHQSDALPGHMHTLDESMTCSVLEEDLGCEDCFALY